MAYPVVSTFRTRLYDSNGSSLAAATAGAYIETRGYISAAHAMNLGTSTSTAGAATVNWQVNGTSISGSSATTMTTGSSAGSCIATLSSSSARQYVNAGDIVTAVAAGGSAVPFQAQWMIKEF